MKKKLDNEAAGEGKEERGCLWQAVRDVPFFPPPLHPVTPLIFTFWSRFRSYKVTDFSLEISRNPG